MTVSLKAMKKWQIVCSIPKPAEVQGTLLKGVFKICDEARYFKQHTKILKIRNYCSRMGHYEKKMNFPTLNLL